MDEVVAVIVKSGGPENNGTQAEAVKWHDDKVRQTLLAPLAAAAAAAAQRGLSHPRGQHKALG